MLLEGAAELENVRIAHKARHFPHGPPFAQVIHGVPHADFSQIAHGALPIAGDKALSQIHFADMRGAGAA